ncbi:MAG TPA: hypothetical protein VGL15_11480 [Vicinamibacteria bacterium]
MTCSSFEAALVDLARGQEVGAEDRAAALAHALYCERCADRFAADRAVSVSLRELADRTAGAEAPPRVEERLRATFRRRQQARAEALASAMPPRRWVWMWATAAAAAFVFVVWTGGRDPRVMPTVEMPPPVAALPPAASTSAAGSDENGFIPLTWGPPLSELDGIQVVHVQMPASALPSLGWTVAGESLGETVDADVLVSADGVARALRIVHAGADETSPEDNGGHS